jgi:hypothetical protein
MPSTPSSHEYPSFESIFDPCQLDNTCNCNLYALQNVCMEAYIHVFKFSFMHVSMSANLYAKIKDIFASWYAPSPYLEFPHCVTLDPPA